VQRNLTRVELSLLGLFWVGNSRCGRAAPRTGVRNPDTIYKQSLRDCFGSVDIAKAEPGFLVYTLGLPGFGILWRWSAIRHEEALAVVESKTYRTTREHCQVHKDFSRKAIGACLTARSVYGDAAF